MHFYLLFLTYILFILNFEILIIIYDNGWEKWKLLHYIKNDILNISLLKKSRTRDQFCIGKTNIVR